MALSAEIQELIVRLSLHDGLTSGVNKALGSVGRLDKGMGKAAKGAGQLGKGVLKAGAVAAIAAGTGLAFAAHKAIEMDDAFAAVVKTVGDASAGELQALNDQLHALATRIPVNYTDLAGIAAEAGALGVARQDIAGFTETVARLSAATQGLSTEAAAEAFGKFRNSLHLTEADLERSASALIALGNAGASSEGDIIEIGKRFAGAGKTAGLSAAQVLGLSSAIASLGVQPEAAGGSLSRLFNNINKYIGTGDKKLQAFAKTAGETTKQFAKGFQTDALGQFQKFLEGLSKLTAPEQQKRLKEAGVVNTRDINAIQLLAGSWQEVGRQTNLASDAFKRNTDLADVSAKRFDTLKNKITVLKNNFSEATYNIAEGFLPALGRATDKLTTFLQLSSTKTALQDLGKKLGATLDKIDFGKLLTAAKGAVDVLQPMLDALLGIAGVLNSLPADVKGAALAAIVANKASGGLIGAGLGNIIGGLGSTLAKSLAASIPVFGKAFVQPVFVTNKGFGAGGGPGGVGGAITGGSSKLAKLGGGLVIATDIASVIATQQQISAESSAQGKALEATLNRDITTKTPAQLKVALAGVEKGINDLQANPLNILVQGSALDSLKAMEALLKARIQGAAGGSSGGVGTVLASVIRSATAQLVGVIEKVNYTGRLEKYLGELKDRSKDLRANRRGDRQSGDREGARLITVRLDAIARREEIVKRGIDALKTSQNPKLTKIATEIDIQNNRLGSLQHRLHIAKEAGDTKREADLRRRIQEVRQKIQESRRSIDATRDAARRAGTSTTSATHSAQGAIVGAIVAGYSKVPVINVLITAANVQASIDVGNRSGTRNGSHNGGTARRP